MLDLKLLKSDLPALLAELGVKSAGNHCRCLLHDSDHMEVTENATWRCGNTVGNIIDARRIKERLRNNREAVQSLGRDFGQIIAIDLERAEKFLDAANVVNGVGFLPSFRFAEWPDWELKDAYVIPILDPDLKAVKLIFKVPYPIHHIWAPFSESYSCLYPAPPADGPVNIYDDELKAIRNGGTALTTPDLTLLEQINPERICIKGKKIRGKFKHLKRNCDSQQKNS